MAVRAPSAAVLFALLFLVLSPVAFARQLQEVSSKASNATITNSTPAKKGGGGGGLKWWQLFIIVFIIAHLPCIPLIWWLCKRRQRKRKGGHLEMKIQDHFVKFIPLREIEKATNDFSKENMLGEGGYGAVYKGVSLSGEVWAVKKSNRSGNARDLEDFQNEVDTISKLSHRHLVQLLGFCNEDGEMILVYEYMEMGNLREHLVLDPKKGYEPLKFAERLDIAIGSARGLHYLHNFAREPIIHRDVKSENILLDSHLKAKVADFGLLKNLPVGPDAPIHVTTRVAGTLGYLDPEYQEIYRITAKSDVYSFGVVLLELITGRTPIIVDPENSNEHISVVKWAVPQVVSNNLDAIIDPNMTGEYDLKDVHKMATIALMCLQRTSVARPSMEEVVRRLEHIRAPEGASSTTFEYPDTTTDGGYTTSFGQSNPSTASGEHDNANVTFSLTGR